MSATIASRLRVRRLNSVDLPTFGRPTMTMVGIITRPAARNGWTRRFCATLLPRRSLNCDRVNAALDRLHEDVVVKQLRLRDDRTAIGRDARDKGAVFTRHEMHITLKV